MVSLSVRPTAGNPSTCIETFEYDLTHENPWRIYFKDYFFYDPFYFAGNVGYPLTKNPIKSFSSVCNGITTSRPTQPTYNERGLITAQAWGTYEQQFFEYSCD